MANKVPALFCVCNLVKQSLQCFPKSKTIHLLDNSYKCSNAIFNKHTINAANVSLFVLKKQKSVTCICWFVVYY